MGSLFVVKDVFLNDSTGPYQLTYSGGDAYSLNFSLENAMLDGYKLLFGYVYTAWNASYLWMDYHIMNPLVLVTQGTFDVYIKDSPRKNMNLDAGLKVTCILIKRTS